MSMNQKNSDDSDIVSDINMTPLIDIMLVLLIIFMVTSSAAIESGLDINVPEINTVSEKTDATLIISLTKTGEVFLQGQPVKAENLQEELKAQLVKLKTDSVILEGDGESSLSRTVEIMDLARSAGAKNFSIAAKEKPKG